MRFTHLVLQGPKDGVEYSLRAFPLGGYVAFPDDDPDSDIDPEDPNLLRNRPIKDRAIVISAGVIANVVFANAILFTQMSTVGLGENVYRCVPLSSTCAHLLSRPSLEFVEAWKWESLFAGSACLVTPPSLDILWVAQPRGDRAGAPARVGGGEGGCAAHGHHPQRGRRERGEDGDVRSVPRQQDQGQSGTHPCSSWDPWSGGSFQARTPHTAAGRASRYAEREVLQIRHFLKGAGCTAPTPSAVPQTQPHVIRR
jgi:hypothetical protein